MRGKHHSHAHASGMRGSEQPKAPADQTPDLGEKNETGLTPGGIDEQPSKDAKSKKPDGAFESGMRGADKPTKGAQATAADVAQTPQLGANTEALAQGEFPKEYDQGDHYAIPKAHLVDAGDHYKLPKKK